MLTLARALGRRPRLLLADELSLGLAPLVVERLLEAVRAACRTRRAAAYSSSSSTSARRCRYADRVYIMARGRIQMNLPAATARERIAEIEQTYLAGRRR